MNVWGKYFHSEKVLFDYENSFWEEEIQNLIATVPADKLGAPVIMPAAIDGACHAKKVRYSDMVFFSGLLGIGGCY